MENRVMAIYVSVDKFRNEYRAILNFSNGTRLFRRLGIAPTPGIDHIDQEDPIRARQVWKKVSLLSNELGSRGVAAAGGTLKFGAVMTEFLVWREQHRNNANFANHSKRSIEKFGKQKLDAISRQAVAEWVEELAAEFSHYTVRNIVDPPKQLFNWLKKQELYTGSNVFAGHEWEAKKEAPEPKSYISTQEWELIRKLIKNDPIAEQAVTVAYFTGLRPSEALRVRPEDFDHAALTLNVRETKTRKGFRLIAIPRALSAWAMNHDCQTLSMSIAQHRMVTLKKEHPALASLTLATFRKSYAAVMEEAGATHEQIDAHQGRYQSSVIAKHYLRDKMRAVRLLRPFVSQVFDGGEAPIRSVSKHRLRVEEGNRDMMWVVKDGKAHRQKKPANLK